VESWKQSLARLSAERLASLKRQAFLLCGDDQQADDLVQDALVRVFARSLRASRPDATDAYLRKIMVNLFIDQTRRQSRWHRSAPVLADEDNIPDPAEEIVTRGVVRAALDDLSPRQRACIVLRYYQDLPVAQVAAALGVAEGTAKRYLSEAMTKMAARLSPVQDR